MKEIMEVVNAGLLFTVIAIIVIAVLLVAGFAYLFFFYFQPNDAPPPQARKRVKTLMRAKGPAQTHIRNIEEPHPDTHGDVVQAVYPRG